jgi:hypothetical protein
MPQGPCVCFPRLDSRKPFRAFPDQSPPPFRGATVLHELGKDDITIKDILRHSDVRVTRASYIKKSDKKTREAMDDFGAAARTAKKASGKVVPAGVTRQDAVMSAGMA